MILVHMLHAYAGYVRPKLDRFTVLVKTNINDWVDAKLWIEIVWQFVDISSSERIVTLAKWNKWM